MIVSAHPTRPQPASRASLRIRFRAIESRGVARGLGLLASTMVWALIALPCGVAVDEPVLRAAASAGAMCSSNMRFLSL